MPYAFTFTLLQGLLVLALAIPFTVIPLLALELLGAAQAVSTFYLAIGVFSLSGALALPMMLERLKRMRMILLGTVCIVLSTLLFPLESAGALFVAAVPYTFGFFAVNIVMNVIIMESILRQRFVRFEAMRMSMLGLAFTIGPWLGVRITSDFGIWWPFVAMTTIGVVGYCFVRNLINDRKSTPGGHGQSTALHSVLRAPTPRAACLCAGADPVVVVKHDLRLCSNLLRRPQLIRRNRRPHRLVECHVCRSGAGPAHPSGKHVIFGYIATALAASAMTALAGWPLVGIIMMLFSCLCAALLDAVGNAPFVRTFKPHERAR
ncbi:MAG: hypothetical protein GDA49_04535 [Rhodospirillales bacterium]|nr:hypothetical protein [Rhodospirillales bacterium]